MSDFSKTAVGLVETLIASTWTDIGTQFRVSQGAWYNWRDRVKLGDLVPPFAVVSVLSELGNQEWGAINKAYTLNLAVYYVRTTSLSAGEEATGEKVEDFIYPKMAAFRDALMSASSGYQLIEDPVIDVGVTNPANEYLSVNSDAFWAGEIRFGILVGESYH